MVARLLILTGLQLLSSVNKYESKIHEIVEINPDFENWYLDNAHNFNSVSDIFNEYHQHVLRINNKTIVKILHMKMKMNKQGWTDEYFKTQPQYLKELAWKKHDASQTNWNIRQTEEYIDEHFLEIIPDEEKMNYENALALKKQFECAINYKPTDQRKCLF